MREWAKWVSKPVNGASERSEAERCGGSERSERCERTNVASDRVAYSKRDCLWLETPSVIWLIEKLNGFDWGLDDDVQDESALVWMLYDTFTERTG